MYRKKCRFIILSLQKNIHLVAIPLGSKYVCLPRVGSGTCGARTGRVGARCTMPPCPATPSRASTPGSYNRAHQPTSRIRYSTTPQVERAGKGSSFYRPQNYQLMALCVMFKIRIRISLWIFRIIFTVTKKAKISKLCIDSNKWSQNLYPPPKKKSFFSNSKILVLKKLSCANV